MHAEVMEKLREHLAMHPLGFPRSTSKAQIHMLEHLFDDDEAQLAVHLSPNPETADSLASRLGQDPEKFQKLLDAMSKKGLILKSKNRNNFRMMPFMPGMYEFQINSMDKELALLFEDLYPELAQDLFASPTAFTKVLAVEKHLPVDMEILPYERASQIVKAAGRIAVSECICRKEQKLLGKGCSRPLETCIVFAPMDEQYIDLGLAQPMSVDEALKCLEKGEKAGLVRTTLNVQSRPTFICQCCSCCCALIKGVTTLDIPTALVKSGFHPVIEWESCNGCEACTSICPMKAISMEDEKATLNETKCIGCGLCVSECPLKAITLEARPKQEVPVPPSNFVELMTTIGREKGKTYFYK